MQFNQFNLYSMQTGFNDIPKTDEVDVCMNDLITIDEYEDVKNYIINKFGNIDGEKWIDYENLNKKICLVVDNEKIEFFAIKNGRQYYSKGWKVISKK